MKTFDTIVGNQGPGEPRPIVDPAIFAPIEGCPVCRETSGTAHAGRERYAYCTTHSCRWSRGEDHPWTVSAEQLAAMRERWATLNLDDYKQVSPWRLGAELAGLRYSDFKP